MASRATVKTYTTGTQAFDLSPKYAYTQLSLEGGITTTDLTEVAVLPDGATTYQPVSDVPAGATSFVIGPTPIRSVRLTGPTGSYSVVVKQWGRELVD